MRASTGKRQPIIPVLDGITLFTGTCNASAAAWQRASELGYAVGGADIADFIVHHHCGEGVGIETLPTNEHRGPGEGILRKAGGKGGAGLI